MTDTVGVNLLNFQVLPFPSSAKAQDKLLAIGLNERGFTRKATFLLGVDKATGGISVGIIAKLVRE